MKKIILMAMTGIMLSFATQAQKIAHINISEIMTQMPEYKNAGEELKKYQEEFVNQLTTMEKELQTKYEDYMQNSTKLTEAVKEVKEKEITQLNQRIEEYRASAQEKVSKKEADLMKPIADKITNAIQAVAKAKGYDYILETSATHFANPALNVSTDVKAQLGIK